MVVELQPVKPIPMSVWRCTLLALSTLPLMFTAPPPVLSVSVPALPLLSTPKTTWVSVLLTLPKSIAPPVPLLAEVGVRAAVWSATSFTELRREGLEVERWNALHPEQKPRIAWVTEQLAGSKGPIVAASDYMKVHADQIRAYVPAGRSYRVLGTDGFGRSDFRRKLREHFEINRHYIVVAALKSLAEEGKLPVTKVAEAIAKYGIQADKVNPLYA